MWPFRKKLKVVKPSRFPERGEGLKWMREQVAYYRQTFPESAWRLFSPYAGDYMPIYCACGFTWDDSVQAEYRQVKAENPDLVKEAWNNRPITYGAMVRAIVGDASDYDPNVFLRP